MGNKPSKGSSEWRKRSGPTEWEWDSATWPETDRRRSSRMVATGSTSDGAGGMTHGIEGAYGWTESSRHRVNDRIHAPNADWRLPNLDSNQRIPVVKSNSWAGHSGSVRRSMYTKPPAGPIDKKENPNWQWSSDHRNILHSGGQVYKKPVAKSYSWHSDSQGGSSIIRPHYGARGDGSVRSSPASSMKSSRGVGGVIHANPGSRGQSPSPYGTPFQTPRPNVTRRLSPNHYGTRGKSPSPHGTPFQTPRSNVTRGQSQSPYGTRGQSPSPYGTRGQTPSPYGTRGRTPSPYGTHGPNMVLDQRTQNVAPKSTVHVKTVPPPPSTPLLRTGVGPAYQLQRKLPKGMVW
ncbi:unnamed protein product, partial [Meganyctiphanes norvegica]